MNIGIYSKNTPLKVYALIFAFFSWIYVLSSAEIQVEKPVGIRYLLPDDMAISSKPVYEAHFTLSGPRAFIRNLLSKNDVVQIDLRTRFRKKQKTYEINMQSADLTLPFGVTALSVEPRRIKVDLSPLKTKEIKVIPKFIGEISSDHKLEEQKIIPSKIKIKGPVELLANIKDVETQAIDLEEITGDSKKSVGLVPFDSRIEMSHSQIDFEYVIKPTRANMILRKVPITFQSSKIIKNANKRFVTLMVLADKGSNQSLTPNDVKVICEVPNKSKGVLNLPLKVELPKGVHLLEVSPKDVKVIIEDL